MKFLARIGALIFPWPLRALLPGRDLDLTLNGQFLLMSDAQHEVALWAYKQGRPRGFGETMRAIAWQESSFGINLENPNDRGGGSFGVFGGQALAVARRYLKENDPTEAELEYTAEVLKQDRDVAAWACLEELEYWYKTHGENWPRIWASYNAGWRWDTKAGRRYAQQIADKINYLRKA